jgi:hypothetical protein
MRNKKHIKIVKVFLSKNETPQDIPQHFDRFPRMYLELLENKSKIKNDLVNVEYTYDNTVPLLDEKTPELVENYKKPPLPADTTKQDKYATKSDEVISENISQKDESKQENDENKNAPTKEDDKYKQADREEDPDDSNNLSSRLKQLLKDDSAEVVSKNDVKTPFSSNNKPSVNQNQHTKEEFKEPPSLAELQANGLYKGTHTKHNSHLKDLNGGNYNEQEIDNKKREILFKFDLLKKSYPFSNIQDFSIHSDLQSMEVAYNDCVRRLSLDSSVEEYKKFLIGGFMVVEYVFGNFLGLEMQGFTQQQIISMNSYEKLLIELGEKSYVPKGSNWSVEVRLVFMIIINAAVFLVSKIIMKKTGANLMGMMNNMNNPAGSSSSAEKKKKMKGPDLQEI